jgi:hypothetical protein
MTFRVLQNDRAIRLGQWRKPVRQPKIDWKIAPRGLKHVLLNTEFVSELVSGQPLTITAGSQVSFAMTQVGEAFDSAPDTSILSCPTPPPGSRWSMEAFFYCTSSANSMLCTIMEGTSSFDRSLGINASGTPYIYIYDPTGIGVTFAYATNPVVAGRLYHFVGTCDGATLSIYVNGILSNSVIVHSGGYAGFSNPTFSEGAVNDATANGTFQCLHKIVHAIFANETWSADEVLQRYLDPYGFLAPVEGDIAIASTGAAPSVITGTLAATDLIDTASLNGTVAWSVVSGSLVATEAVDHAAIGGTVTWPALSGNIIVTENPDSAIISGVDVWPVISGNIVVTETDDTISAMGSVGWAAIIGSLMTVEKTDVMAASAYTPVSVDLTKTYDLTGNAFETSLIGQRSSKRDLTGEL